MRPLCRCAEAVFCLECYKEYRARGFSECPVCRRFMVEKDETENMQAARIVLVMYFFQLIWTAIFVFMTRVDYVWMMVVANAACFILRLLYTGKVWIDANHKVQSERVSNVEIKLTNYSDLFFVILSVCM